MQREKLEGKRVREESDRGEKKRKGINRVLVVGGSMIRGIEEDLGELLGKGFEVKVVSMSGGKMWDVMRHLGKWTKEKMDWCGGACGNKPHTEGDGDFRRGRVWKGGRKIDRGSRQAMWEGSRDVIGADTEGGPRGDRVKKH